jgi:acetylornithine/succinyldiaminopimelate/putrescine aminotransferase
MAIAAAEQLLDWTIAGVAASLRGLTDQIAQHAGSLGLKTSDRDQRGPHMLGIELPREIARAMAQTLSDRGVIASVRGSSLRIAPHLHITQTDLDLLLSTMTDALGPGLGAR